MTDAAAPRDVHSVGFVGIGQMGWPMAANLARAGYEVSVVDLDADRVARFVAEHGGHAATEPASVVAEVDLLVTMLPSSREVALILEPLVDIVQPGTVVLEMSSGMPSVTQALATSFARRGVVLVDAPVSGGVKRAVSGELTIMCGGDAAVLAHCDPVLRAMGTTVHHCGPVGAGQTMKALNNLVSAGGLMLTVEALLVGQAAGLDPAVMTTVLNSSTGMTNSSRVKIDQFVLSRSFASGFSMALMSKDLDTAARIAGDAGLAVPFAELCAQLWRAASTMLGPGTDHTAISLFSEQLAGLQLAGSRTNEDEGD